MGDDLARWRQQLREEDSDDEGGDGSYLQNEFSIDPPTVPNDLDLGLALDEMPLPKRPPKSVEFGDLPPRAGKAPPQQPTTIGRAPLLGGLGGVMGGGGSESQELLQRKLQVLELKLEERDIELEALRQQANGSGVELNDARETKMRDLAKRAKAATMALGRERAANAQLKADLVKKTREAEGSGGGAAASGAGAGTAGLSAAQRLAAAQSAVGEGREGIDPASRERELKEAKDALAAASARAHEARLAQQSLKAELDRYKRALSKEVGDDATLSKLLDEASGAKGRAEQIFKLKEQVKALSKRLGSATSGGAGESGVDDVPPTPMSNVDGADGRQRGALNAIEADRRREHERALLREQELSAELVEARKRTDAMAARIRNLETDVKGKKDKLRVMIQKSDADDQLVQALRAELEKHRKGGAVIRGGGATAAGQPIVSEERRAGEMAARLAQQQSQIDRQEQIIVALREQVQRLPPGAAPSSNSRPGSARQPPQDLIVLETENAKLRELVSLLQDKLAEATSEDSY